MAIWKEDKKTKEKRQRQEGKEKGNHADNTNHEAKHTSNKINAAMMYTRGKHKGDPSWVITRPTEVTRGHTEMCRLIGASEGM